MEMKSMCHRSMAFGAMVVLPPIGRYYGRKIRTGGGSEKPTAVRQPHRTRRDDAADVDESDEEVGSEYDDDEGEYARNSDFPTVFNSIVAVAPPGKLGLVISNPTMDVPVVLRMKERSALRGRVRAGDLLLSVDEVDCTGMSASEVSDLIGRRDEAPERTLLLLREQ